MSIKFLSQQTAKKIDEELFSSGHFVVETLVELAGLAVAQCVAKVYPTPQFSQPLVAVGVGNNGADGLVAARHLFHFGYKPRLFLVREPKTEMMRNYISQCEALHIPIERNDIHGVLNDADLIVDAIFGFSFKGEIRDPFGSVIQALKSTKKPIISVDLPSAWDVDEGNVNDRSFTPDTLISLTAPKLSSRFFKGRHFLGGRFIPPDLANKFQLNIPPYQGTDQIIDITDISHDKL